MCNREGNVFRGVDNRRICSDCDLVYSPFMVMGLKLLPVVFILSLLVFMPTAAAFSVDSRGYAYIDDANVRIEAPLYSNAVNPVLHGTITPKSYSGDVHVAWGFDRDVFVPSSGGIITDVTTEYSLTCEASWRVVDGVVYCERSYPNGTTQTLWQQRFDRYDIPSSTIWWDETVREYQRASSVAVRRDFSYNDKDTWFVLRDQPISPTNPLEYVLRGTVPLGLSAKYDVAIFPSSYPVTPAGIQSAISDGVFYYLDPFVNATFYEAGNTGNASNGWDVDNASTSTVYIPPSGLTFTYGLDDYVTDAIAGYTFDDADLTTGLANDVATGNFDVTINLADTGVAGLVGESYDYVQANSDITTIGDLDLTPPFSISFWFNPDVGATNQGLLTKRNGDNNDNFLNYRFRYTAGNNIEFYASNTVNSDYCFITSSSTFSTGSWYHVVVNVPTSGSCELFGNNASEGTDAVAGTIYTHNDNLILGSNSRTTAQQYFDGSIDELYFYDHTLDASQRAALYNSGSGYQPYNSSNTSRHMYRSVELPMSANYSQYTATWDLVSGSASVNVSCDGATFSVATNNTLTNCASGDTLEYAISLSGVGATMNSLEIVFPEAAGAPNTPPNVTQPTFSPTTPNRTQDVVGSTTYSDADGDSGNVLFYWRVDGSLVFTDNQTAQNGFVINSTLSSGNYSAGQVVVLSVNATDGTNTSATRSNSFTVAGDTVGTGSPNVYWVEIVIYLSVFVLLVFGIFMAYKSGSMFWGVIAGIIALTLLGMITQGTLTSFVSYTSDLSVVLIALFAGLVGLVLGAEGNK